MSVTRGEPSDANFQDSLELSHAQAAREARAAIAHDTAEASATTKFRAFVASFAARPHPAGPSLRPMRVSRPVKSFAGAGQHGMETIDDTQGRAGWQVSIPSATDGKSRDYLVGSDGHVYAVLEDRDEPVPTPEPELLAALERALAARANPLA